MEPRSLRVVDAHIRGQSSTERYFSTLEGDRHRQQLAAQKDECGPSIGLPRSSLAALGCAEFSSPGTGFAIGCHWQAVSRWRHGGDGLAGLRYLIAALRFPSIV